MNDPNEGSASSLTVNIGGRDFHIGCGPEERDDLYAAAELLNSEISSLQTDPNSPPVSLETGAVVVALNLAGDLLRRKNQSPIESDDEFSSQISRLVDKIESVLEE